MSDLVERLRAEPEHEILRDDSGAVRGLEKSLAHQAADEIDRLRAERDALAQDAERYRFIREDGHYLPKSGEWLPWVRGGSLDTLVDAALAQIEKGSK